MVQSFVIIVASNNFESKCPVLNLDFRVSLLSISKVITRANEIGNRAVTREFEINKLKVLLFISNLQLFYSSLKSLSIFGFVKTFTCMGYARPRGLIITPTS